MAVRPEMFPMGVGDFSGQSIHQPKGIWSAQPCGIKNIEDNAGEVFRSMTLHEKISHQAKNLIQLIGSNFKAGKRVNNHRTILRVYKLSNAERS